HRLRNLAVRVVEPQRGPTRPGIADNFNKRFMSAVSEAQAVTGQDRSILALFVSQPNGRVSCFHVDCHACKLGCPDGDSCSTLTVAENDFLGFDCSWRLVCSREQKHSDG